MTALLVDAYQGDGVKPSDWTTLALCGPPWCGGIVKASEGATHAPAWFVDTWPKLRRAGGPRYGIDWFRGAYHYLRIRTSAARDQAENYLAQIERGGGWSDGDLWPIVDVERAGNEGSSARQVIDVCSAFAERILAATGRAPMLYGGSWLRELGIRERMGCQLLWIPRYTATLPKSSYTSLGFDLSTLWAWQYCGGIDSPAKHATLPATTPIGQLDISAITIDGGVEWTRTRLGSRAA